MIYLGALIGDYIGSSYEPEQFRMKDYDCSLETGREIFTDDSILTIAVLDALLTYREKNTHDLNVLFELAKNKIVEYTKKPKYYGEWFGEPFLKWIENPIPYGSNRNGAAMRISCVGYVANTLEEVKEFSLAVTDVSHNTKEAETAALAVATSVFLLRNGATKEEVQNNICEYYPDILSLDLDEIRPNYGFEVTCNESVPHALKCFIDSHDFEDSLRLAISMGGDSDTMAAIACSLSALYYGVPEYYKKIMDQKIDDNFRSQILRLEKYLTK